MVSYLKTIDDCVAHSKAANISRLVLDVRSNGGILALVCNNGRGGIICLAQASHLQLFPEWNVQGSNHLFEPYDMRKSKTSDSIYPLEPEEVSNLHILK